jgi:hypothetical protein
MHSLLNTALNACDIHAHHRGHPRIASHKRFLGLHVELTAKGLSA